MPLHLWTTRRNAQDHEDCQSPQPGTGRGLFPSTRSGDRWTKSRHLADISALVVTPLKTWDGDGGDSLPIQRVCRKDKISSAVRLERRKGKYLPRL